MSLRSMTIQPNLDDLLNKGDIIDKCVSGDDYKIDPNGDGIKIDFSNSSPSFSFSFQESRFFLTIDLLKKGIPGDVLDFVRPKIRITQKVNHRRDCSARLLFAAQLNSERFLWDPEGKVQKEKTREWEQWVDAEWEEMSIEFSGYPSGIRHLNILNQGSDRLFWKGFYGPKITDFKIEIIMPSC
uniref:FBA domain-containing protein n=1 Tax=Caenorhabditis tropicalis TaxID=1561998 RepID=A0A1I7TEB3_9PELO